MLKPFLLFTASASLLILTACSDKTPATTTTATPTSVQEQPSTATAPVASDEQASTPSQDNQELAALYNQSCIACHSSGAGGAPRKGNATDWAPRMAKGMDVLLDHTINGFKGMPPLGMCMDCDETDFTGLIQFMANAE